MVDEIINLCALVEKTPDLFPFSEPTFDVRPACWPLPRDHFQGMKGHRGLHAGGRSMSDIGVLLPIAP